MTESTDKTGFWGALKSLANETVVQPLIAQAESHAAAFGEDVSLDIEHRRVFISDSLIAKFIRSNSEKIDLMEFEWDGECYRCRAQVGSRTLSGRLTLDSVHWDGGQVTAIGTTPDAPTIEGAPVQSWLLGQFVALFGGTSVGESVLSNATPPGVTWNGRRITWTHPLDTTAMGNTGIALRSVSLDANVAHDARGLWITVDSAAPTFLGLVEVVLFVLRLVNLRRRPER
jgi:hypothetical protein